MTYSFLDMSADQVCQALAAKGFLARLRKRGANAHLRCSRGADIAAACGRLRQRIQD